MTVRVQMPGATVADVAAKRVVGGERAADGEPGGAREARSGHRSEGDGGAPAQSIAATAREGALSVALTTLNVLNRPFRGLSMPARNIVGYVGLITLAFAAVAWAICLFG